MDIVEFKAKYKAEIATYKKWGAFVNEKIINSLSKRLGSIDETKIFIKIPPKPRVKGIQSIVAKAFYRGKNYTNPYNDITDKVGVRYVVLLRKNISTISSIIEAITDWNYSKDRDFEEEIKKDPYIFGYQSVHYVVRNKSFKDFPIGIPCEIQIRTLTQHAYCELTHDTLYKPNSTVNNPVVKRFVAKSMALIETTDDIFGQVDMVLEKENEQVNSKFRSLKALYECIIKGDYDEKTNLFILDALRSMLDSVNESEIEKFVGEPTIKAIIRKRNPTFIH